uniref:NADH-ubiquinone oxidoreductase chain 6 n=1 Tax=Tagiades trebellius martinus TaxID=3016723 RepID=A0AA96KGP1_9NEOP|nr:NADH dehydrogenase subunit 6 [Tagiades trebellius martinus]
MKLILSSTMIIISILMFFLKHPLSMGLTILIQTLMVCLISGLYIHTYWFSYILFLTFSGGLLVLFIYVSSIASNELFFMTSKNTLILTLILMLIMMINLLFLDINFLNLMYDSFEMNNLNNYFIFINNNNNINLTKLYNEQTYFLMILMITYLFITLIAVVKITNIFYGPLRSN